MFQNTNRILGLGDPDLTAGNQALVGTALRAGAELAALMQEMAEDRRKRPRDDLPRSLLNAELEGGALAERAGVVLHPARRRRQRDHAQRHQSRHEGALRPFRTSAGAGRRTSTGSRRRRSRRSCAGRRPSSILRAPRRRIRTCSARGCGRRQGRALVRVGESRRGGLRGPASFRRRPLTESPRRLRRPRPALLPRREPRAARDRVVFEQLFAASRTRDHRPADRLHSNFIHGIKRMPFASRRAVPCVRQRQAYSAFSALAAAFPASRPKKLPPPIDMPLA